MNSPNHSPRARRRSPTAVQDTSPRRRRNRFDKNQQQQRQQQQQQQQRRFPKLPPYHVLDVFGERGLFLIDGDVPVESLARMGLVLPLPWMPAPGTPSPPPQLTTAPTSAKSNRKPYAPTKNKNSHKLTKANGHATRDASPPLASSQASTTKARTTPASSPQPNGSISKDENLVHNVMAVNSVQPRQVLSQ